MDIVDRIRKVGLSLRMNGYSVEDLLAFLDELNQSHDPLLVIEKWTNPTHSDCPMSGNDSQGVQTPLP